MFTLWNWLCNWIDGFINGELVSISCEYCPFAINENELSHYPDESAILVAALEHDCPVESRRQMEMVSRSFGCRYDTYTISKSLWGSAKD